MAKKRQMIGPTEWSRWNVSLRLAGRIARTFREE